MLEPNPYPNPDLLEHRHVGTNCRGVMVLYRHSSYTLGNGQSAEPLYRRMLRIKKTTELELVMILSIDVLGSFAPQVNVVGIVD